MTYPKPEDLPKDDSIHLHMSSMEASWLLHVLENHVPTSSSENGHIKMTIDSLKEEFKRKKIN